MNIALAQKIQGWMTDGELCFLAEHASKSNLILEVGSYRGRSTRAMADNTSGIIHAIDPWDGKYQTYKNPRDLAYVSYHENGDNVIYSEFYTNLLIHIHSGKVKVTRSEFHNFHIEELPDMIFIDAIHEYDAVKRDISHAVGLMKHGLLCGHDYTACWPGVIEAVNETFGKDVNVHESIWWINL